MDQAIIQTVVSACVALVVSYSSIHFAEKKTEGQQFSLPKFIKTLLFALLIGALQYETGMSFDQALQWVSTNAFLTWFIDDLTNRLVKVIRHHFSGRKESPAILQDR